MCTAIARKPGEAMGRELDSRRRAVTESEIEGLWREGDYWALRFRGREARLRHIKGLGYLAALLEHPGTDIHVFEIVAAAEGAPPHTRSAIADREVELRADDAAGAGAGLDAQAKAAYRARIEELREEIEQARDWADGERAARAQEELDFIARELARAVGLGGRDRPTASQAERARQNVGRAINNAVRRIAAALPELGAHLERAIHTGASCSYRPEPEPAFVVLPEPPGPAMSTLPPGTVTVMLTDIEGSTRLFTQDRLAASQALRRYGDLVTTVVAGSGGTPLQENGEGDSSVALFARATDAVACALELQRAMEQEDWPGDLRVDVRVALHAGEAELEESDRPHVAVNRCAQMRAVAHGGQVLVSGAVHELAGDELPADASLRDLGQHRLPDLDRPEHLFQLTHPDLPHDFPPLRSAEARRHNLPLQLTTFVGRERELLELAMLLDRARLVTLTGAGGSGKTRLAIELAARKAEQARDGAWLVDLAPVFDNQLVLKAVARVLGVRERPHSNLLDDILERLRESQLLLVLDNCEHLADSCARLAEDLLQACPEIRLLATSREPLGVPGERVFRTGSLAVPATDDAPDAIARAEAVILFADRAAAALGSFELDSDTAPVVAHICRRLDGLPLAIELAAARTTSLSLDDLASHLDDCFALLTGGARTALPRQRTLEATVAWSYDLLGERQRALFDRLSVFAGGWTLDAAENVCAGAGIEPRHVAEDLAALVDKSLVVRDALEGGRTRYRLLETLRQYGRNKLSETSEAAPVRDAHLNWAVELAETAERHLDGLEQAEWLDLLERELDNLRAALEWAITSRSVEAGLRLASITHGSMWVWRGHVPEGQRWVQRLLATPAEVAASARAKGLLAAGRLDFQGGEWARGVRLCKLSRDLYSEAGDAAGEARALLWLAFNRWGIDESHETGDAFAAAIDAARRAEQPLETAIALGFSGMWWALRDLDRAQGLVDEAGILIERAESPNWLAHSFELRALVAYLREEIERARELLSNALPIYLQIGNRGCSTHCMESTAAVAAAAGRPDLGAELLAAAERMRELLGVAPPPYERIVRERGVNAVNAALDTETAARAWQRGRELGYEDAMALARALV
jgi:predicted ATPase/class 3 adenylate cyclase